jgi:hypothetical protein
MPRTKHEIEFDHLIYRLYDVLNDIKTTTLITQAEIFPLKGMYMRALRYSKNKNQIVCCYCRKTVKRNRLLRRYFHFCTMKAKDIVDSEKELKKMFGE